MFHYFNQQLFAGELPPVILNFSRHNPHTMGFFAPDRWVRVGDEQGTTHEVSLNPDRLIEMGPTETAQTMVHELCHLWQHVRGTPSRTGYHNREWGAKMIAVGLQPSSTGQPGGRTTGQKMADYPIPGGRFLAVLEAMPAEYLLPWASRGGSVPNGKPQDGGSESPTRPRSKVRYQCPGCGTRAWGKPGIRLLCGCCSLEGLEMETEEV